MTEKTNKLSVAAHLLLTTRTKMMVIVDWDKDHHVLIVATLLSLMPVNPLA